MLDESEHEVLHTSADGSEIKSYQCEHCNKTFLTMSQLTSHRWQHTRPFTCDFCREKFPSKGKVVSFLVKNFKTSNSWRVIVWFIKFRAVHNLSLWLYEFFWIILLYGHLIYFISKVLAWELCSQRQFMYCSIFCESDVISCVKEIFENWLIKVYQLCQFNWYSYVHFKVGIKNKFKLVCLKYWIRTATFIIDSFWCTFVF